MILTARKKMIVALGVFASILFLALPSVSAGGWAAVIVDALPVAPRAGAELRLGFMIRQHGVTPVSDSVQPYLTATHQETGESIQIQARQEGATGHFVVEVTFPSPGTWRWNIVPAPFPAMPSEFEPLTVLPASDTPAEAAANVQSGAPLIPWWPVLGGCSSSGGLPG